MPTAPILHQQGVIRTPKFSIESHLISKHFINDNGISTYISLFKYYDCSRGGNETLGQAREVTVMCENLADCYLLRCCTYS